MARPRTTRTQEIIDLCKKHLLLHGPRDWAPVQATCTDVSISTFYRLIGEAKKEIEAEAMRDASPSELRAAQMRIRARIDSPAQTERKIKAHLPVAPSPAIIASVEGVEQTFDFMRYFHRIVADAEMLRAKSVKTGEDGREQVANPMMMDNSIRRRLQIMDTYVTSMEQMFNLEKIQELYAMVIDEVKKADPATGDAILARLRELNNRRGLTMAART